MSAEKPSNRRGSRKRRRSGTKRENLIDKRLKYELGSLKDAVMSSETKSQREELNQVGSFLRGNMSSDQLPLSVYGGEASPTLDSTRMTRSKSRERETHSENHTDTYSPQRSSNALNSDARRRELNAEATALKREADRMMAKKDAASVRNACKLYVQSSLKFSEGAILSLSEEEKARRLKESSKFARTLAVKMQNVAAKFSLPDLLQIAFLMEIVAAKTEFTALAFQFPSIDFRALSEHQNPTDAAVIRGCVGVIGVVLATLRSDAAVKVPKDWPSCAWTDFEKMIRRKLTAIIPQQK